MQSSQTKSELCTCVFVTVCNSYMLKTRNLHKCTGKRIYMHRKNQWVNWLIINAKVCHLTDKIKWKWAILSVRCTHQLTHFCVNESIDSLMFFSVCAVDTLISHIRSRCIFQIFHKALLHTTSAVKKETCHKRG